LADSKQVLRMHSTSSKLDKQVVETLTNL